jgi:hypothetical protein
VKLALGLPVKEEVEAAPVEQKKRQLRRLRRSSTSLLKAAKPQPMPVSLWLTGRPLLKD